jgi:hypothetical protein
MQGKVFVGSAALLIFAAGNPAYAADPLSNLPFNLAGGTPNLDLRLRYEHVKVDEPLAPPITEDVAEALTVRARLGYTTGKWNDIDSQLEFEGLSAIGNQDFNSTINGETTYPVVADPKVNELNQAWVRYSGLPKTQLKYGRQRLIFDNARFIGNVGWRQMEQTYDASLLTTTLIPKTTLNYAYLTNVNSFRYFNFAPAGSPAKLGNNIDIKGQLLNAQFAAIEKKLVLTGYAYLLDFDEIPSGGPGRLFQDTKTLGLRATGAIPVQKLTLSYALEYADQKDYKDAPSTVDASYNLLEAGLGYGKLTGKLGYEVLEGDGVYSFQTPLATAHAHQGWADQFLITPLNGLQHEYLSVNATLGKSTLQAVYHEFKADKGSTDYGSEVDLLASYPLIENFVLSAKYATYSADEFPTVTPAGGTPVAIDTNKYWLYAEYKF